MEYNQLTKDLYRINLNWVYSLIKKIDQEEIEKKDFFLNDPYKFNQFIALGYYYMTLYTISNLKEVEESIKSEVMHSIIEGASKYNCEELSKIYKKELNINDLVDQYNVIVKKCKIYSPTDGIKARIVSVDTMYRSLYETVNIQHFNSFLKVIILSYNDYNKEIKERLNKEIIMVGDIHE